MKAGANILIVDDEDDMRFVLKDALQESGYFSDSAPSGEAALDKLKRRPFDIVISDLKMPGMSGMELLERIKVFDSDILFIMMTAYGTIENAVTALKSGAFDYILKPFSLEDIKHTIARAESSMRLTMENRYLRRKLREGKGFDNIVGESPPMLEVYDYLARASQTSTNVLILGESGTGKEVVARTIHQNSDRRREPFIPIHCAAIPENLLESELFGHEKGAFTGAHRQRIGKLEAAGRGTIFLDEVGTLPLGVQVKLLRVLQEREIERLGGNARVGINARLLAASNRDLKEAVDQGLFREDLFYRLNVFPIFIPPLRDRTEDIAMLAVHFAEKFGKEMHGKLLRITNEALTTLKEYPWPGNVRELENAIERAAIMCKGWQIVSDDLSLNIIGKRTLGQRDPIEVLLETGTPLEDVERKLVIKALEQADGNQTRAAELLGITRKMLFTRVKKFKLG